MEPQYSSGVEWFYKGNWKFGLPSGEGAVYWENCQVEKGVFVQGLFAYGDSVAMGFKCKWFNEYDVNGNQKFSFYNGDKLYADGYVNMDSMTAESF